MKKILVIVDMQNDFIFRDCALGSEPAEMAYKALVEYLAGPAGALYEYIVFTRDTHYTNYMNTSEGAKLPVPHCIKDTSGWEIPERLYALAQFALKEKGVLPTLVDKITFGSVNLPDVLDDLMVGDEEWGIEFCGLCTDICVVSNVLMAKAFFPETPITVYEKFCAGVTPESHAAAIATMKSCQIDII